MSPITPRRFQEIEVLSRELFPEEEGSQHQLCEDRRLAIRELLQERAELRNRVQELFRQLPNLTGDPDGGRPEP